MNRVIPVVILMLAFPVLTFAREVRTVAAPPAGKRTSLYVCNKDPILATPFIKLPIGSITPRGWLRHQLDLMRNGMTGRLAEVSPWLKFEGNAWTDPRGRGHSGWEEMPYWLKGFGDLGYVTGDARIIVMHHNPVKGELSQRHGLKNTQRILGAFAEMGVDLVLCGHDHQEAVHYIEHTRRGTIISTAGTVSNRSRGGRPSSVNSIRITESEIEVSTLVWSTVEDAFVAGPVKCFPR